MTNWAEYDAALRQRGSLTVWFTDEAIAAWRAVPRTTRGGQPLLGSGDQDSPDTPGGVPAGAPADRGLDRLDPAAPRPGLGGAGSLDREPARRNPGSAKAVSELRKTCSPAGRQHRPAFVRTRRVADREHGTRRRRSWRKLHIGLDAASGQILASELTSSDVDDGSQVEPLLDQITAPLASFIGDGAYDQAGIYDTIAKREPDAEVIVPPRSTAILSETAEIAPTQRDRHLQSIVEHGRRGWQKRSGYTRQALAETSISRFKRVIGDGLRSRTDRRRAAEIAIAVHALNQMLAFGRPKTVRIA